VLQLLQTPEEFNESNLITVTGLEPAREWQAGVPADNQKLKYADDGRQLWDFFCALKSGRQAINLRVRIPCIGEPEWEPGRIRFGGLVAPARQDGVRLVVSFNADTFTQADPPSVKRPKADGPPMPAPPGDRPA